MKKTSLAALVFVILLLAIPLYGGMMMVQSSGSGYTGGGGGTTCSGNYGETAEGTGYLIDTTAYCVIQRQDFDCTADSGDMVTHMKFADAHTSDREIKFVVYEDNGSGTDPADSFWISAAQYWSGDTPETGVWHTDTVDAALSGTYIWTGYCAENGQSDTDYFYTSNTPNREVRYITGVTFASIPTTWPTGSDTSDTYGMAGYLSYP